MGTRDDWEKKGWSTFTTPDKIAKESPAVVVNLVPRFVTKRLHLQEMIKFANQMISDLSLSNRQFIHNFIVIYW